MNKVILMGRLTRDPDVRYSQGADGSAIARFTLAVDRRFTKEQAADFISCVAFGKVAENIEKWVRKGVKVAVTGRIQTGSYTNKDGVKIYTTDVVVEDWEFAESKSASQQNAGGNDNGEVPQPVPTQASGDGFMSVPDGVEDQLPFQ